jgi:hypothetical protein
MKSADKPRIDWSNWIVTICLALILTYFVGRAFFEYMQEKREEAHQQWEAQQEIERKWLENCHDAGGEKAIRIYEYKVGSKWRTYHRTVCQAKNGEKLNVPAT